MLNFTKVIENKIAFHKLEVLNSHFHPWLPVVKGLVILMGLKTLGKSYLN
jgi:hypothetical protein